MATISFPNHVPARRSELARELPVRLKEVDQIHDVNYGLLLSSIVITIALMALAWFVTVASTQRTHLNPLDGVAQVSAGERVNAATMNHSMTR